MHLSIIRRGRRGIPLASLIALSFAFAPTISPVQAGIAEQLTCESCLLIDAGTGRVLFERSAQRPLPNASTTKMTTALVVIAHAEMRELVRVGAEAALVGGGGLDLAEGDVYTVRDLLYALLLDSSNEAAAALAAHVGGDIDSFVAKMNRTARTVGATDTHFENPHGLDAVGHHSTAADLALIGIALLSEPDLAEIVATPSAVISVPGGTLVLENRNVLLEGYAGVVGIKTGRTLGAGEVLVAAAERGSRSLIAVAMRSLDAAADARHLLDLGFERLRAEVARARLRAQREPAEPDVLVYSQQEVGALVFDPAGSTVVVAGQDITGVIGSSEPEVNFVPADEILLPIAEGEQVGTVEVLVAGSVVGSAPALAREPVAVQRSSWPQRAFSGLLRTAAVVIAGIRA